LCQKECYPVAFVLVNCSSLLHPTLAVNPPRIPSAPVAAERSCEARQRLTAERSRHRGRLPLSRRPLPIRWTAHGRAPRIAAISFRLRSTACFKAKGFKLALCCRNRCLVCAVTWALPNTRAKGVWAAP